MTFERLLDEALATNNLPGTGDVLAVGLPLLRQLNELHDQGLVSRLSGTAHLDYDGKVLQLSPDASGASTHNERALRTVNPQRSGEAIEVIGRYHFDHKTGDDAELRSGDIFDNESDLPERPLFVAGYRAWEQHHGHHDALTDIHIAGLVLISYATGLNFANSQDLERLVHDHRHLGVVSPTLHPVVAGVLMEMATPDRHRRPAQLSDLIFRLEHHRELPTELDLSKAYESETGWRRPVLEYLRERVFDVSRRNRALHYKPSASTFSLTEASVPMLLNAERINPAELLTWTGKTVTVFREEKPVDLERWCRFEEAPHLAPGLDKLISSERKLRAEHGQGRLHLVIAFLRWFDPQERSIVSSPLLLKPAQLSKKKGVKRRYRVQVENEALVNPILRHVFADRFDIKLPERLPSDSESIAELVNVLEKSVQTSDPAIRVELIDKPRISLIRHRAQVRVDTYKRRRARAQASSGRWRKQDHSYTHEDWRPLGLSLYQQFVEAKALPLRFMTPAKPMASGNAVEVSDGERKRETYSVVKDEANRHRWEVDLCDVTLASLGSRRTSLARDYDELLGSDIEISSKINTDINTNTGTDIVSDSTEEQSPFEQLFSPEPRTVSGVAQAPISIDQSLVLPADDTQARAVRRAVAGESFIIQGPPGTGKSQTIANLIAALVSEGKRVLFVCEKRAALDVVAHRLNQVDLGDLITTIHDSQLDRKSFIAELGQTYKSWIDADVETPKENHSKLLHETKALLSPIENLFAGVDALEVRQIVERLVKLRLRGIELIDELDSQNVDVDTWMESRSQLDEIEQTLATVGAVPTLAQCQVLRVNPLSLSANQDPVDFARQLGLNIKTALADLAAAIGSGNLSDIEVASLETLAVDAPLLAGLSARGRLDVLEGSHNHALAEAQTVLARTQEHLAECEMQHERWTDPLSGEDALSALEIARAKEGSFFSKFSGDFRKLKKLLNSAYDYSQHRVKPTMVQVLSGLCEFYETERQVSKKRVDFENMYGTQDPKALIDLVSRLANSPTAQLVANEGFDAPRVATCSNQLSQYFKCLLISKHLSLDTVEPIANELSSTQVGFERILMMWSDLANQVKSTDLFEFVLTAPTLDHAERCVLDCHISALLTKGQLSGLNSAQLDAAVIKVQEHYKDLLKANAKLVAAQVQEKFKTNFEFSEASMAGRGNEDKETKRVYRAGRKILEREFEKKMRHRSIRDLASGESGKIVRDLKPVWLMSPLSVSDTLPLDADFFDVVVFDEASQIPVEDAVPSLFRASQVIVVGDRMQLPPTKFFSAGSSDDDELVVDHEGSQTTLSMDADSFLTQADLSLDSTMLTWHYRSRFESLIAYSNNAFYGGKLATIPDRSFEIGEQRKICVETTDEAKENVAALVERPISFHYLTNATYGDRRNIAEAQYVAELVRSLLNDETPDRPTLGIVAFSQAQQEEIEEALAELAAFDRDFAQKYEAEQTREDDGEFVGLFVKNLENVQGDERDIIIMSVCYGRTVDGAMRMNFGPINQDGGERRLNVIFSRAKQNMAVVSSIVGADITNTHNEGAANLARFLDYAAAESCGDVNDADALLEALLPRADMAAKRHVSAVASELAEALRSHGFEVDTNVGRSQFRIDVAVRAEDGYELGIVVDPGLEASPTTARFVSEAMALSGFGWNITRVVLSEWWTDTERVLDRLIAILPKPNANTNSE